MDPTSAASSGRPLAHHRRRPARPARSRSAPRRSPRSGRGRRSSSAPVARRDPTGSGPRRPP
ncbi:hypothetical protein F3087_34460 [Nocardia colli]|uniref:Uncharacterized protein n=1 Tax=Nocardia colli TaxID=2545717 RepID=A0A5N0E646_9NOCA|nr:hypothetical protein F3087_34460 [Nocardia colli]